MKEFKIRASATGQIMGDGKGNPLTKTAMSYVENWYKEQLYSRKKEFTNKYVQKGIIVEDNSLDFVAEQLDLGMLIKNEQYFENEFCTGTPDVILNDLVIDVKNSWDCFTFPLFECEIPNKDYFYQAQTYLYLTGKKSYKLIYCLTDTPLNIIEKEAFFKAKDLGFELSEMFEILKQKMTYLDIPNNLKIKIYNIQRCEKTIQKIEEKVIECRKYLLTIKIK
jgi:hypothetical protein